MSTSLTHIPLLQRAWLRQWTASNCDEAIRSSWGSVNHATRHRLFCLESRPWLTLAPPSLRLLVARPEVLDPLVGYSREGQVSGAQ